MQPIERLAVRRADRQQVVLQAVLSRVRQPDQIDKLASRCAVTRATDEADGALKLLRVLDGDGRVRDQVDRGAVIDPVGEGDVARFDKGAVDDTGLDGAPRVTALMVASPVMLKSPRSTSWRGMSIVVVTFPSL
jgi:hypothetical protein